MLILEDKWGTSTLRAKIAQILPIVRTLLLAVNVVFGALQFFVAARTCWTVERNLHVRAKRRFQGMKSFAAARP